MIKKRVGIYGGTFSPPHLGHIGALAAFAEALPLDELLIIPDFLPPHKNIDGEATTENRLEMCRLAFSSIKGAKISEIEILRGGRSYTSVTLEELSMPDTELYFLMGTDMFLTLGEWYRPEVICSLATICLARRESDLDEKINLAKEKYFRDFSARIITVDLPIKEISSSEVRAAIKDGRDTSSLLSSEVDEYIRKWGLYR